MEKKYDINVNNHSDSEKMIGFSASKPFQTKTETNALTSYSHTTNRNQYDSDIVQILEVVRILDNVAPKRMPEYNFNADEINGERFYKNDGSLIFIRDLDSDVIRDYYYDSNAVNPEHSISKILEHDKNTGRLRVKKEPITRAGSRLKSNIAIFDEKNNNKYTIIQLAEGGIVSNISEFSGNGKSFQTLFRNVQTLKPARYLEGKDNKDIGFSMTDCIFTESGEIARIKRYCNRKTINIDYTSTEKRITVNS